MQYRNKSVSARELLENSRTLQKELGPRQITFVVNDRPDVALLADAAGVHLGQEDIDAEAARKLLGPHKLVGVSTHNPEQFLAAAATSAGYISIGPIFPTSSKANPDPVVGLDTLRAVRRQTDKPVVAIGGITLENAREVLDAGADSLAVISDVLRAADPAKRARQFIDLLEKGDLRTSVQDKTNG